MPSLNDLPVEVLLDNLLPSIPTPDLLSLSSTNHFFALLGADNTFWKRKLAADFNFSSEGTARTNGWKLIYRGLSRPKVFTWGENSHSRLGLSDTRPIQIIRDAPFPCEVKIPGIRIVGLVAGGMSFHALDSVGDVYVWGTLDGTIPALNSDGFSDPGKMASTPLKLQLPAPTRNVSCGRLHSMTLDDNLRIWNFLSWGRPFRFVSALLDSTLPESTPVQVECGWAFSSVLTKSGDVLVWWPFSGPLGRHIDSQNDLMDAQGDKKAKATEDGIIPCSTWEIRRDPYRLPSLPTTLPRLANSAGSDDTKLIKIAALDNNLIGLTDKGHVLKFGMLGNETTVSQGRWEYLPLFSEVEEVQKHSTFSSPLGENSEVPLEPPRSMHVTHISAHFRTFIAYSTGSSSIVLMGNSETTATSVPTILPALQHKSVIAVVLGDYHYGALTSTGKLLTWGAYSRGALGLGDPAEIHAGQPGGFATEQQRLQAISQGRRATPPRVDIPTEVRFDHGKTKRKDTFCFSAAAAGWHMGALVVDLEPNSDDDDEEARVTHMPGHFPSDPPQTSQPPQGPGSPPLIPPFRGSGIFRIGFAGRGINRRGRRRGD